MGVKRREGVSGMEGWKCEVEVIDRKGCVGGGKNERRSGRWEFRERRAVTGGRGGVEKGQVEREESSEETTGEHKPREQTEEKTGGVRGETWRMSREEKTREETKGGRREKRE